MAGLQQRVEDLASDVRTLTPLVVGQAKLEIAVTHIQTEFTALVVNVDQIKRSLAEGEDRRQREREDQLRDSRNWRRALVLGSFTVLAALIAAAATIIVSAP